MGSQQNRIPHYEQRRKRWGAACFSALSCFGGSSHQKGGKRIVPASRIPEGNHHHHPSAASQPNGHHHPPGAQPTPSLLAPPSSPASFSHSALPSTAQSPSCHLSLSANSHEDHPSSTMFATGPYAHETQLVSPPVFSTFTTEPSTAPLTPPPELAHLTTPSSPDVPFAQFLTSSSRNLKPTDKNGYLAANDLQATYSLYPGSPASSLRSPTSRLSGDCLSSSFREREFPSQWAPLDSSQNGKFSRNGSGGHSGHDAIAHPKASQDANFFCPATFAQFYLDQNPPFPNTGGRLSISKESDTTCHAGGNGHQNRYNRSPKQDVEELEAYRASFGFSADEIVTTPQYVEISDVMDDSFTMTPFPSDKASNCGTASDQNGIGASHAVSDLCSNSAVSCNNYEDYKSRMKPIEVSRSSVSQSDDEDDIFAKAVSSKIMRKYQLGLSSSDAEIDYRRGRSLREGGKRDLAWRG